MSNLLLINIIILFLLGVYLIFSLNKPLSPQLYVKNTFIYLSLALGLTSLFLQLMKQDVIKYDNLNNVLVLILGFVMIFTMFSSNKFISHISWIVFILFCSSLLYPVFEQNEKNVKSILITTVVISLSMILLAYTQKKGTFKGLGKYLFVILFSVIVLQLVNIIVGVSKENVKFWGYIAVVLFSLYLMYDIDLLRRRAEVVSKYNVNYPAESVSIFLDMVNLFMGVSNSSN